MKPIRIQRKRTKGWKMPPNTVYVGRPTRWSNPFRIGIDGTRNQCIELYKRLLLPSIYGPLQTNNFVTNTAISEGNTTNIKLLKGKNLACWCPLDKPCHADILLRLANET